MFWYSIQLKCLQGGIDYAIPPKKIFNQQIMSAGGTIEPSFKFVAVTKSDTAKLTYNNEYVRTKALFIGGAGDVAVKNDLGTSVTFQNVPAGSVLPISTDMLLSTGTGATNVVALF